MQQSWWKGPASKQLRRHYSSHRDPPNTAAPVACAALRHLTHPCCQATLQVSGVRFVFDPTLPPGQRVVEGSVSVGGAPLQPDRRYSLITKAYLAEGKDGKADSCTCCTAPSCTCCTARAVKGVGHAAMQRTGAAVRTAGWGPSSLHISTSSRCGLPAWLPVDRASGAAQPIPLVQAMAHCWGPCSCGIQMQLRCCRLWWPTTF